MNFFRKIKDIIDRRKAIDEIYDDIKNLDEVLLEKRLEILNEIATPKFSEIGLNNWNGKYLWFSDFNEDGLKFVVEYNVFKGFGGSFSFGICYDFIPTISSQKKLTYHRTDKSTKIIYYKRLQGWQKSYENNSPINPDKISTVNEEKFRKSLTNVVENNIPKLKKWFDENETIEQNITSLLSEIKNPPYEIGRYIISFEYILGFINAKKNNFDFAEFWINKHFENRSDEVGQNLILDKLKALKKS
ncbi:hypothetical protein [Flavobacterium sp. HNIBRBA15423]|uniref:hypothetical protein n=1 Tax=Flavobacterium sp. HNIBRBA15423 TaxID=3458683 RepID=UPI0040447AB7